MAKDYRLVPAGLWTAPASTKAPNGALLEALNVVSRRPGLVEPRPGFKHSVLYWGEDGPGADVERLHSYAGHLIAQFRSSSALIWDTDFEDPVVLDQDYFDTAEVRKNLYLPAPAGLHKITGLNTAATRAGAPTPAVLVTGVSNGVAVEVGMYVAYRVLTMRKDANGVEVRSAVSGRTIITATSADRQISLKILLATSADFRVGDTIEVYRTVNETTTTPTDELFLAGTFELDAGDLTAGYLDVIDNVPDEELGVALYTNPNQEGIEATHLPLPAAKTMRLFNKSLFLGNLTFPAAQTFNYTPLLTGFATGVQVGVRTLAGGSYTNGSPTVTVTDSSLYKVGQIVDAADAEGDWSGTGYVRITAIPNGTTLTMSHNWAGSTGAATRAVVDSIRIGSEYFPAYKFSALLAAVRGYDLQDVAQGAASPAGSTVVSIDAISDNTDSVTVFDSSRKSFRLTGLTPNQTAPQIWATNGAAYEPVLPEPTVGTGYSLPVERLVNGVMWSNPGEPEHFKAVNIERVGHDADKLMALRTGVRGVICFKTDGAYIVTGVDANTGFRVDELDKSVRMLYPAACAELGTKVYVWGDLGVFECDENGCTNISHPSISDLLIGLQREIGVGNEATPGVWMAANRKDGEVMLSIPQGGIAAYGTQLFVFNQGRAVWTRWFEGESLRHGIEHSDGLLYLQRATTTYKERALTDGQLYASDLENAAVTITAVDTPGTGITIAGGSGWTPAVGDLLLRAGTYALVVAITDATHFEVERALTTGAATAYDGFSAVVTPIAGASSDPGELKTFGEGAVWFHKLDGLREFTLSFKSSLSNTAVTSRRVVSSPRLADSLNNPLRPEAYRFRAPRRHMRCTRLYPSVQIRQAGSRWAIEAVSVSWRQASNRVRNT